VTDRKSDQASLAAGQPDPTAGSDEVEVIEGGEITISPDHLQWKDRHESETAKVLVACPRKLVRLL
jgi:hypothetical protein